MLNIIQMEELIKKIRLKAENCGDATREQRARKGAYVDCIVMIQEALSNMTNVSKK